ncbi:phosphoribosyltransferase family protein [Nocardia sp. NPDC049707]|uniref:phosphoribosyltransferase n=1 Tax=Nocardia sp. NPDC049707 TaxID=3154735 RepID=UPI0034468487
MMFVDRRDAGRRLGLRLRFLHDHNVVVLGVPRGGVPVAYEVARALDAPLDLVVVRRLGVPGRPEIAFGAVGEHDVRVRNAAVARRYGLTAAEMARIEHDELEALAEQVERLRAGCIRIPLLGRPVVIVDDGVSTGATARAACRIARLGGARRVVWAVPVIARDMVAALNTVANEVIRLETPVRLFAIGQWYRRYGYTSEHEVVELLRHNAAAFPWHTEVGADDPVRSRSS